MDGFSITIDGLVYRFGRADVDLNPSSITGLAAMPDSKNDEVFPAETIEDKVASRAELNRPFSKLWWHVFQRSASFRVFFQKFHTVPDRVVSWFYAFPDAKPLHTLAGNALTPRFAASLFFEETNR
nr:hypothetical protein [Agrobacterium vitis]